MDNINEFIANNCLLCAKMKHCAYYKEFKEDNPNRELIANIGIRDNELFGTFSLNANCPFFTPVDDGLPF